jgi:hypothetical protein
VICLKKSAGKLLVIGLIRSFIVVLILLGVGAGSYWAVMHFWDIPVAAAPEEKGLIREPEKEPITKAVLDDISKNLIFRVQEETGEINGMLLEIFHCEEKRMQFITIPIRTQYTMSEALYRKLVLVHPTIPQVIRLSNITKYFDKDAVYDYGVLIMEDLLGIDISYYTAIPESIYTTIFKTQKIAEESGATSSQKLLQEKESSISYEAFSDKYIKYIKSFQTVEDVYDYLTEIYPSVQSNLTLSGKMNYLESYCKTPLNRVSFALMNGVNKNNAYYIEAALARQQIESYIAGNAAE